VTIATEGFDGKPSWPPHHLPEKMPSALLQLKPFIMEGPAFTRLHTALAVFVPEASDYTTARTAGSRITAQEHVKNSKSNLFSKYNLRICADELYLTPGDRVKISIQKCSSHRSCGGRCDLLDCFEASILSASSGIV
jgi:hypothetical protein